MKDYRRKNYYMVQTLQKEIENYKIISFDLFDTLLLRDVLFPNDVIKLLAEYADETVGIGGFHHIREDNETDVRSRCAYDDILLDEIYDAIEKKLQIPCDQVKQKELELEREHIYANPVMKQVFDAAVQAKKRVVLISDMYLPSAFLDELLHGCGYTGYERIIVSGEIRKSKSTGSLYKYLIEEEHWDPSAWLHIGDNWQSDSEMARKYGITDYYYQPLRDRYFADMAEKRQKAEEEAGMALSVEREEDSIASSLRKAAEINAYYTRMINEPADEIAVKATEVSMMFNMSIEKVDNIKEYVIKLLKGQLMFQEFWALKNISFEVRKGEKIGLIGLNGSGKSTLLKIISGVLKPTKGKIEVHGSIAPLIELGAGFDMNLSAKENVYLNGAILGYSHNDMKAHYNDIISFAELKEFEDVPIKNYSSGMVARLGFAIATCHVPDILIIDEILSVGDFAFQKKCYSKMQELTGMGATVLFVSHSAGDIIDMCDKAIWLDHGKIMDAGEAEFIVNKYLRKAGS